ncbi:uncharacterized protein At5g65660-like [Mangifera indica]|uniref:uncharacterized protein At5g65660-like n=1 Tax=Mangifera indica TaxID=29780 RepID=UPI001CFB6E89|nr:uncharacterized protein At5g65660-like [Mangifera indica]
MRGEKGERMMENEKALSSARPLIGFPLGLALLLFMLLSMSGIFTCCLHWDKLRSLVRAFRVRDDNAGDTSLDHLPSQKSSPLVISKQKQAQSLLVSMPGDEIPKFVALACPCKPPTEKKLSATGLNKNPTEFAYSVNI